MTRVRFPSLVESASSPSEKLIQKTADGAWDENTLEGVDWDTPLFDRTPRALCAQWLRFKPFKERSEAAQDAVLWKYFQWVTAQNMRGEMLGMCAAAQLIAGMPTARAKEYASMLGADEVRHHRVLGKLYTLMFEDDEPAPIPEPLRAGLEAHVMGNNNFLMPLMALYLGEVFGDSVMGVLSKVKNPLMHQIYALISRDEHRHLAFGYWQLRHYLEHGDPAQVEELKDMTGTIVKMTFDSWVTPDPRIYAEFEFDQDEMREHWRGVAWRHPAVPRIRKALEGLGLRELAEYPRRG